MTGVTESIIKLLLDKELRHDFGANAAKFAKSHFDIELVAAQWEKLIVLQSDYDGFGEISDSFLWQDFKWAREVNRRLKRFPLFKRMPSLIKYEAMAKQLIR